MSVLKHRPIDQNFSDLGHRFVKYPQYFYALALIFRSSGPSRGKTLTPQSSL